MPDVLLACTLFREGGSQLAGPAMIKSQPTHTIQRIAGTFCRWAGLPAEQVQLQFNGFALNPEATIAAAGLASGSAVTVMLAAAGPDPAASACAAPFAMLDVRRSNGNHRTLHHHHARPCVRCLARDSFISLFAGRWRTASSRRRWVVVWAVWAHRRRWTVKFHLRSQFERRSVDRSARARLRSRSI